MGQQIDGATVTAILIGFAGLLTYLVSRLNTKGRSDARRLRNLAKRDIEWAGWAHSVRVWAASHGYSDLPKLPALLADEEEDEA